MSFLADIFTYWTGNPLLAKALPLSKVWTGLAPEGTAFPYAVITPVSSEPSFTTGSGYFEAFVFQISLYDTDLDNVEALAATIMGQFDYKLVGGSKNISCERENYLVVVDPDTPEKVYHAVITYRFYENRSL
jgi:hypothetical protein